MTTALPLLYQSGYITIKDYDRESDSFILAIPNKEVHTGLLQIYFLAHLQHAQCLCKDASQMPWRKD